MSLELARPEILLALLGLPIVAWLAMRDARRARRRRAWAAALRTAGMAALIIALAEPRMLRPVERVAVAFLVDRSDSVPAGERARAEALVAEAIDAMTGEDRAAIVAFGERALLDRAAREGPSSAIQSQPGPGRTDLASALRLGQTALPDDAGRRMIVLSDGRSNVGALDDQIRLAKARSVAIDVVPLAAKLGEGEVLVAALEAPSVARVGQNVRVEAVIRAPQGGAGRLQLFDGDDILHDERLVIAGGDRRVGATIEVDEPGFRRFRAVFSPDADIRTENNAAAAYTLVAGPPRVLVIAGEDSQSAPLISALEAAGRSPELRPPAEIPTSLFELAEYNAIVLVDIAARQVSDPVEDALLAYVRDRGGGLIMVGGEDSFGSGGWRHSPVEKALPVEMEVRDKERRPDIAIAYVIDKSGSMGSFDGPGLGGSEGAPQKVDLAKDAAMLSASLLAENDRAALVAFDGSSHLVWPIQRHEDPRRFDSAVSGITSGGGTNIQAGIEAGLDQLASDNAPLKHLILLSDGQSDSSGYDRLIQRLADERVTLTSVGVGQGASTEMARLAEQGGGRYYPVVDSRDLPSIFVEDTLTALGTFIVEETFRPVEGTRSQILSGLDIASLPPLHGYNGVEERDSATVALWSHLEDPVLAHGQYGLGRSAAWMSDLKGQWAADWLEWPGFGPFVIQLVDWVTPPPEDEDFGLEAHVTAGRAEIALTAVDADGSPSSLLSVSALLSGPDGRTVEAPLTAQGAGRYAATAELPSEGTWLLRVTAHDSDGRVAGARTAGLVVPYSPEYADPGVDPIDPRLLNLAAETGGRVLTEDDLAGAAFERVDGTTRPVPLWPALVALAALLLPADIAARRLRLRVPSRAALGEWVRQAVSRGGPLVRERTAGEASTSGASMAGAASASASKSSTSLPVRLPSGAPPDPLAPSHDESRGSGEVAGTGSDEPDGAGAEEPEDTLSRLRRARDRARRR